MPARERPPEHGRDRDRERERWQISANEWPRWDERNRIVAAYIPPGSAVVDLGSGAQTLREHLPPGCSYQPCDLVPGPAPVIGCDLEAGRWPELPRRYDVAVCSGLLEYMPDVGAVLAGLRDVAPRALVTYSDRRPGQHIEALRRHAWKSFLTLGQLRAALDASGAAWRFLTEWHGHVIAVMDFALDLPPLADGEAVIEDAAWEAGFADLEAHARRTGISAVAPSLVADGRAIGLWAEAQRRLRRRGTLSARRAARLEALPGWSWRPRPGSARAQRPAEDPGALRARRVTRERPDWVRLAAQRDPVLDLDGAAGGPAIALARSGLRVTAFDPDVAALAQGRVRLSEEDAGTRAGITLATGELDPLPFADAAFETVLVGDLPRRDGLDAEVLAQARRVLRPGGRIVLTVSLDPGPGGGAPGRLPLPDVLALLAPVLRPVEIADGGRWLGVVAVPEPSRGDSPRAWPALLEVAERRMQALEASLAEGGSRLDEAAAREELLLGRTEELAADLAAARAERDGREAEVRRLDARRAEAERAAEAARAAHAEAEARAATREAELTRRLDDVREDGRLLYREAERREEARAAAEAELAARTARADDVEARLRAVAGRAVRAKRVHQAEREELAAARAEVARLRRRVELEHDLSERRAARLAEVRSTRSFRLGVRLWRITQRLRHPRRGA